MEPMVLGRKNQYCENDYTTKCNLQIQCHPYQITNGVFHRTRTKNFTICMETQKTLNSQSNLEKEKGSWRNEPSWLQTILQSYSHQDSMVLAQRQKYRPVEQDGKPMHLWSPYLWQRRQKYTMMKRQSVQQLVLGNWSTMYKRTSIADLCQCMAKTAPIL